MSEPIISYPGKHTDNGGMQVLPSYHTFACMLYTDVHQSCSVQAVNETGEINAPQAVDVSLQLTVATTANETTSLYIFLGSGAAIKELNAQLNETG